MDNQTLSMASNQFSNTTIHVINNDTKVEKGASFSNIAFTSSNPAIFTIDSITGTSAKVKAIAVGSATLNFSATALYTDTTNNQAVTKNMTGTTTVTITASTAENIVLIVNFGTPVNQ